MATEAKKIRCLGPCIFYLVFRNFNKYEIFSSDQFGFRPKFATEYAVIDIYEKLVKNLDEIVAICHQNDIIEL